MQGSIEEKIYQRQVTKQGLSTVVEGCSNETVQFSIEDLKVQIFLSYHLTSFHFISSRNEAPGWNALLVCYLYCLCSWGRFVSNYETNIVDIVLKSLVLVVEM